MSQPNQTDLILPGESRWERWSRADAQKEWELADQVGNEDVDALPPGPWELARAKTRLIFAAPSVGFSDISLKLPPVEAGTVEELMPLRLEAAGIAAPVEPGVVASDWEEVRTRQSGRVVFAWTWTEDPLADAPASRLPSAVLPRWRTVLMPPRHVVLWRELGQWFSGLTGAGGLLNVQALGDGAGAEGVAADIKAQISSLVVRGMMDAPEGMLVYGEDAPEHFDRAAVFLGIPLRRTPLPPPVVPEDTGRLLPAAILEARAAAVSARRWKLRIAAAAAVWLLAAAWVAYGYISDRNALEEARAERVRIEPESLALREIQSAWDEVMLVNGIDSFPLEVLLRLEQARPAGPLRLTTFSVGPQKDVSLSGSAPSADMALRFGEVVKRNQGLASYQWETPYPRSQTDNTFTFTISGKLRASQ